MVAGGGVNAGPSTADGLNASRGTGAANATTDIPAAGVNIGIGNGGVGNRSTGQRTLHNNTQAMVRMLQQQVQDVRAQNELLQALVDRQQLNIQPNVCTWSSIRPHMRRIPKQLMLGLQKEKNCMYPSEELMKGSILSTFDIGEDDVITRRQFDRAWTADLKKRVLLSISNRRGRFSTTARNALWRLLGIPKPINGTPDEIAMWKDSMAPWYEDCSWRREGDDPFGSDAFCGAIGCVKYGISFNISTKTLRLLPSQLAWFTYVLDLAMQGDLNLKNNGFHKQEMARCEEFIMANQEYIKKIELVTENDFQGIYNEVLGDEDEE